jgi:methyltransferase
VNIDHVWYAASVSYRPLALLVVVVLPWLLLETWRSRRHERALRAAGAIEPPDDVHAWMRLVYPGMFVAMTVEGMLSPPRAATLVATFPERVTATPADAALVAGVAVFLAAKLLKWWAILSLGRFWSFHVLVLPGAPLVESGPYRLMRHPNYVGVMGEIAGVALMMPAPVTGIASAIVFGALLAARIRVEDRLLREAR